MHHHRTTATSRTSARIPVTSHGAHLMSGPANARPDDFSHSCDFRRRGECRHSGKEYSGARRDDPERRKNRVGPLSRRLSHFYRRPFEYAAGDVQNWDVGLPAAFNTRHFIFLKPDVFVIWDQVRSSYPLQWNLHIPAESVTSAGKSIRIANREGVNLSLDFLQDEPLDWTLDWPLESIRADWPLVLRCPYGKGMFVFTRSTSPSGARREPRGPKKSWRTFSLPAKPTKSAHRDRRPEPRRCGQGTACPTNSSITSPGGDSPGSTARVGQFAVLVRTATCSTTAKALEVLQTAASAMGLPVRLGMEARRHVGPGNISRNPHGGRGTSRSWGEGIEHDLRERRLTPLVPRIRL